MIVGSIDDASTRIGRKPEAKRSDVKKMLTPMTERGNAARTHHFDS